MGKPGTKRFDEFTGLDLRATTGGSNPGSPRIARNVDLTATTRYEVRDQLREFATVDAASVGLYSSNGVLRCVLPARLSAVPRPPLGVEYDVLGLVDNVAYPTDIVAVEGNVLWDSRSYLCVSTYANGVDDIAGRLYEHHYSNGMYSLDVNCTISGADVTLPTTDTFAVGTPVHIYGLTGNWTVLSQMSNVVTLNAAPGVASGLVRFMGARKTSVDLPFQPGRALAKLEEKVWASDARTGDTRFCSTEFGPTNWTAAEDAGFLPTSKHETAGNDIVQGYGAFNRTLAVFYQTTIQLWEVAPDPADHEISSVVGGAGTEDGNSIANIFGDVIYFGQGGFHSLKIVTATGQAASGDLGAAITALTDLIPTPLAPKNMLAVWSPSRGQYFGFYSTTAYVWRYSPVSGVAGWTTYEMPFEVSATTESNGKLFIRRKDQSKIYVFDPTATDEEGFDWALEFPHFDADAGGRTIQWKTAFFDITGDCTVAMGVDSEVYASEIPVGDIRESMRGAVPVMWVGQSVAARFRGSAPCTIDGFTLRYEVGSV